MEQELARLEKNRERRFARDRAKGLAVPSPAGTAISPDGEPLTPAAAGGKQPQATQRKCANCGQIGHIKTNKKCVHCNLPMDSKVTSSLATALDTFGASF